ncbi:hypothetical protein PF010_g15017 [Phytophthora fragariae]|uniref:Vps16 N-terminal domain-containing protein n=1 Tax=Phytophthora fragariae TaxID=53985 RepID=A0A6G0KW45_9STRA|nr:hypothetical protein PF010_g15017 [Phytophthora fragariae]
MTWANEGVTDLRDFVSACAPFGGPVALLRDPKKLVKVASGAPLARQLLLFNACGCKLGHVDWTPFEDARETLVGMTWTDELRLLCVFTSGSYAAFSMAGDEETRFSLLLPGSKDKVATFEAWGGGLVALTEKMALVHVLDVDSVRPKVSLLPDCGLSDANPPMCMAVLEPKFLKSIYPDVLLGSSNRSLVVVGKDGIFTELKTMMDKKILSFDTQSKASPLSLCWCGEDSVLMYWPRAGLVMVGPYGAAATAPPPAPDASEATDVDASAWSCVQELFRMLHDTNAPVDFVYSRQRKHEVVESEYDESCMIVLVCSVTSICYGKKERRK